MNSVLTDVVSISGTAEDFVKMVLFRLDSLNYMVKDSDAWALGFAIKKTENRIKTVCNIGSIPNELYEYMCDAVCGEFLNEMLSLGKMSSDQIEQTLQSLSLGDASMTFADTGVGSFNTLIDKLIHDGEGVLECYRKLRW